MAVVRLFEGRVKRMVDIRIAVCFIQLLQVLLSLIEGYRPWHLFEVYISAQYFLLEHQAVS